MNASSTTTEYGVLSTSLNNTFFINPNFHHHLNSNPRRNRNLSLKKEGFMALIHSPSSSSLRLQAPLRPHSHRVSNVGRCTFTRGGFESQVISLDRRRLKNRWIVSFAASHEDSKHSKIEEEEEKSKSETDAVAGESQEEWKQALESFKEQAKKVQGISQEAYEAYSQKASVMLKEKSEQLKIQAEKASQDLMIMFKEISEETKNDINTPEEVKEFVETFSSSMDDVKEPSQLRDFQLGFPYGAFLSAWGFLSFMLSGNISAIRFGLIPGVALMGLSISSMQSWKRGDSYSVSLKGQAAIAGFVFLRDLRILSLRPSLPSSVTTFVSGSMVVFFLYKIISDRVPKKDPNAEQGQGN